MLSQAEFSDIHNSVMEAIGYVALPITLFHVDTTTVETDPLYGEAVAGDSGMTEYATINASVRFRPEEEFLTRTGTRVNADILAFIPHGYILQWEAEQGRSFVPDNTMEMLYEGVRYSINAMPRTDPLPVLRDNGSIGSDFIGMVLTGKTKADSGK